MKTLDLNQLVEQAKAVQTRLAEVQRGLAQQRVEGSAGGGMVTAVATGELRIAEIRIEPGLASGGDREMLQDLVAAAVNAALTRAQQLVQEEMQKVSGLVMPDPGSGS